MCVYSFYTSYFAYYKTHSGFCQFNIFHGHTLTLTHLFTSRKCNINWKSLSFFSVFGKCDKRMIKDAEKNYERKITFETTTNTTTEKKTRLILVFYVCNLKWLFIYFILLFVVVVVIAGENSPGNEWQLHCWISLCFSIDNNMDTLLCVTLNKPNNSIDFSMMIEIEERKETFRTVDIINNFF